MAVAGGGGLGDLDGGKGDEAGGREGHGRAAAALLVGGGLAVADRVNDVHLDLQPLVGRAHVALGQVHLQDGGGLQGGVLRGPGRGLLHQLHAEQRAGTRLRRSAVGRRAEVWKREDEPGQRHRLRVPRPQRVRENAWRGH